MFRSLTPEQEQLADTVRRFVERDYGFEARREILTTELGLDPQRLATIGELGLGSVGLPEASGGYGTAVDLALVMEALGRGLVLEPLLWSTTIPGLVLAAHGTRAQKAFLPALVSGECRMALAWQERGTGYHPAAVTARATAGADGYGLEGSKIGIWDGALADHLIVAARDGAGLSLFLVPTDAGGLTVGHFRTYDGLRVSECHMTDVAVPSDALIGRPGDGEAILEEILLHATAALCAEAVGAMDALFTMTLDHLRTRKQFGRALGSFQALQHRAANMYMALENARWLTGEAVTRLAHGAADARRHVTAAKVQTNEAADLIGREAVQLHGGIGITDEHAVSHYFRRLEAFTARCGNTEHQIGRFLALG